MAETNYKEIEEEGDNAGAAGKDDPTGVATRGKKEAQQKKKKHLGRPVDEMKITELKDALRKLNLSTTGNKAELQMRLRGARARRPPPQEEEDDKVSDDATENGSVASDSMTESDDESSDEEATSNKEDRRKKQKDRERTAIGVSKRSSVGNGVIEKQRRRTIKEKVSRSDRKETDDESESESSDEEATSNKKDRRRKRKDRERTAIGRVAKRNGEGNGVIGKRRRRVKKEKVSRSNQTETDDESDSESSDNNSSMERSHKSRCRRNRFTIKDVEGSLTHFSGDDKLPIEKWIEEYEDMSALLKWDSLQKLMYGKRMLTGSAKKFISFEKRVTSWNTLKRRLIREFSIDLNRADVHSQLFKRRMKADENSRQYIYAMQEIASQGYIEEDALIQYIIDGVSDDETSKTTTHKRSAN